MMRRYHDIIRRHSCPLEPQPPNVKPRLRKLPGIRAVLFDVYGTMFISRPGDTLAATEPEADFGPALAAVGLNFLGSTAAITASLQEVIKRHHATANKRGTAQPEVDIVAVWQDVLRRLEMDGLCSGDFARVDLRQLAVEYEVRHNRVWPMPNLASCLAELRGRRLELGIVSNAQFLTPELLPALLNVRADELGFAGTLQFYSYQHGRAKPDDYLCRLAREALQNMGIRACEVVYVGNDMLNDILPAKRMNFRAALFAGDARSLRLRCDDPRVEGVEPDIVISGLEQLPDCLG